MADEIISLGDLTPDPANARKHNPRNVGTIVDALHEVGAARSIVIDEHGRVLAGNATIEGAAEAGIERVQVVDSDGETLIAVRRRGLTEEQKRRLALYDNRAAEFATWDYEALAKLQAENETILAGLFTEIEQRNIQEKPEGSEGGNGSPVDVREHWRGMPEYGSEDLTPWKQIIVSFKCFDDLQAFARLIGQPVTERTKSIWYPEVEDLDIVSQQVVDEQHES